ncbi:hypothetical protein [Haloarcula montana]|uniref:hypothetical protein n=1 Tax=Haloarcula montana TaxID=3111776 RepID=UPI002D76D2E6|nr:hypothetical protein [Haloarcula sp. GH36]
MRRTTTESPLRRWPSIPTALLLVLGVAGLAVRFQAAALPIEPTDDSLSLLLALSGTLLVGGVVNHVLTAGRDLPLTVTASTAAAAGRTVESLLVQRELDDRRVYLPATTDRGPRLVVPGGEGDPIAHAEQAFDDQTEAVVVTPTAAEMVTGFREHRTDAAATDATHHVDALCDGLTAVYDLAAGASGTVDGRQATVSVRGCPLGEPRRIDHPVSSFLATGLATALDRPVELTEVRPDGGERAYAFTVELRWPAGEQES